MDTEKDKQGLVQNNLYGSSEGVLASVSEEFHKDDL